MAGPDAIDSVITDVDAEEFSAALPKQEIQATSFIDKHPEYDGRGVVIAIFDTGVDPGASGLQVTSDGRPKIVDVVDCTGSGDGDTSTIRKADEEGCIEALSGRKLTLNPAWTNPSGDWHVGARAAFSLFPGGLKHRLKEERKRKWDEKQRLAVTTAAAHLAEFKAEKGAGELSEADRKQKEELTARLALLSELAEKYEDNGPWIECVVWNDGQRWLAALDTSELHEVDAGRGALADFHPLTDFRACREYGTFSAEDACNFAVNIYDEGKTLSIVVDAGSHGTHVAGIAAAYHPEDPTANGVAPGAQIVSCKIGDTRLGSMETMTGLTRALITVLANGCDVINMSYGEATATPNAGRFIKLAEEIVHKHGVVYVASAGNAGPALSTVGAPGGTSSALLGIGAYVSPALAAAGHSIRGEMAAGAQYTWSSRGPTPDGDTGVTFSAPGGAVAPVPQWTTQKRQLMNGTSMASPSACGGVALILSAMKAEGQPVTPARLRRAIENTATPLGGDDPAAVLTYGRGLMQVADAHAYLSRAVSVDVPAELRLEVSARRSDGGAAGRGIFMREPADALAPATYQVDVKPGLKEDADIVTERLAVDIKLSLKVTAPWVEAPARLLLHHNGRSFEVGVNPEGLAPGLHYAEVQGFDSAAEWRGPLFRLPITVVKPLHLALTASTLSLPSDPQGAVLKGDTTICLGQFPFTPGHELRRFIAVPPGATWAELKVTSLATSGPQCSYMLRASQLLPHTRYSSSEWRTFVHLPPHGDHCSAFSVAGGGTMEITLAQYWSSLGKATLEVEVGFGGVEVEGAGGKGVVLDGAAGVCKVYARAALRREKIKPVAKLDTLRIPLRPTDAEVAPLFPPRDALPGGRTLHRLLLTYKLSVTEAGKYTPRLPALNGYVYESEVESQMVMVFDANKQLLGVGDIYPEGIALKKGDHVIRAWLRHDDPSLLEKLKALPLVVERKLEAAVTVPVYATNADAVRGENGVTKTRTLVPGERVALFLGAVPDDKVPKDGWVAGGRQLVGSFGVGQTSGGKDAPGATELVYLIPPKKADPPADKPKDEPEEGVSPPTPSQLLADAVRDAQVKFLTDMKLEDDAAATEYLRLAGELTAAHPTHLPLLLALLKRPAGKKGADRTEAVLNEVIAAADAVVGAIDTTALAVYLAMKSPEEGPGAGKRKKDMEERKGALIEALAAKASALLDLEEKHSAGPEAFDTAFTELRKWVDPAADAAHAALIAKKEERRGRLAAAYKALDKAAAPEEGPPTREILEQRAGLLGRLGWSHWQRYEEGGIRKAFPPSYPPF